MSMSAKTPADAVPSPPPPPRTHPNAAEQGRKGAANANDDDDYGRPRRFYVRPTGDETLASARTAPIDLNAQVGQTQLVPAGAGVGRRGRGAGFYCAACDFTLKDTKQYLEHLNKPSHLLRTGHTTRVARATAADVRARVDACVARLEERVRDRQTGLADRLAAHEHALDREAEERRAKRRRDREEEKEARERARDARAHYGEDVRVEGEHDEDDMMAAMGFTVFGAASR